ncbi:hypothetical protein GSY74_06740 [Sulfurovum sp. bin170]|uniref:hypothetical protein n=1 Tax=Sulfurovum sp. bin170 TaxID=2695268 RepID=UPI0013E094CC|nr:hypothetical protein [Sulfurovum sp. bin170]NEW60978.1 hypothetical protein [Sulfurovum sp. bin170]
MGWEIHFHLIAALSWIGGSVFMFVLGISLKDKEDQQAVYPRVGPIFGYFEMGALVVLLITGTLMIIDNGLIYILFDESVDDVVTSALREKLILVAIMTVITIIHTVIAFRTNGKERTKLETILSRGSSMGIFILNFLVLHYAIVIRDIL